MKCDFFVFNHAKVEKKTIPLYNIAKKIPLYPDLYVLRRFFSDNSCGVEKNTYLCKEMSGGSFYFEFIMQVYG